MRNKPQALLIDDRPGQGADGRRRCAVDPDLVSPWRRDCIRTRYHRNDIGDWVSSDIELEVARAVSRRVLSGFGLAPGRSNNCLITLDAHPPCGGGRRSVEMVIARNNRMRRPSDKPAWKPASMGCRCLKTIRRLQ